jgi:hypothetical protein
VSPNIRRRSLQGSPHGAVAKHAEQESHDHFTTAEVGVIGSGATLIGVVIGQSSRKVLRANQRLCRIASWAILPPGKV